MSEVKHTPEPWGKPSLPFYDPMGNVHYCVIKDLEGNIQQKVYGKTQNEAYGNANRIIECVNACAGIDFLENFIPTIRKELRDIRATINADENESTFDEVERLKARCDKMNALLERAYHIVDNKTYAGQKLVRDIEGLLMSKMPSASGSY
jgi:hypothetical protein